MLPHARPVVLVQAPPSNVHPAADGSACRKRDDLQHDESNEDCDCERFTGGVATSDPELTVMTAMMKPDESCSLLASSTSFTLLTALRQARSQNSSAIISSFNSGGFFLSQPLSYYVCWFHYSTRFFVACSRRSTSHLARPSSASRALALRHEDVGVRVLVCVWAA
jgi:hypothetical protein